MKLDTDRAWKDATALLSRNRALLAVLAGVFMFLPMVGLSIAIEGSAVGQTLKAAQTMTAMTAAMEEFYSEFWWAVLILGVAQMVGTLAMLALLKQRARPTVGEALGVGLRALLPYFAAQFVLSAALVLGMGVLIGVGSATGVAALIVVSTGAALTLAAYIFVRCSLVAPIMAIEALRNPVAALARSWALTRGNTGRLLMFFVLIFAAFSIVSAVATMLVGVVFALFGEGVAVFGVAVVSSAISAGFATLVATLLASVHGQLVWMNAPRESDAPII